MKTIFVFVYDGAKPNGGFGDFCGRFSQLSEVQDFLRNEIRKKDGLFTGWEELQLMEVREKEIKILFVGECILSYLGMFSEDEYLVPDYTVRKRFSSRLKKVVI